MPATPPDDPSSGSLRGQLIVATPKLGDPRFRRAVLLILDHDGDGALGVVLNRPTEVSVHDVLPTWADLVSPPGRLFAGGPVSTNAALGLARLVRAGVDEPLGWQSLYDRMGLVELDTPAELVSGRVDAMRIFAGYSGWSSGQLEEELAEGAWYVVSAEGSDVFGDVQEGLWRDVLRRQRGEMAFVASFPDDPSLN
ncbi:MAG TPA: YqgE/AlgH family protein [Nocardioidaceae bacterium]|nr:YqgE/AlgH family protein [Nocardioidaceae bacterium]